MAGLPTSFRNTGIFYKDACKCFLNDLIKFKAKFTNQNPDINIVQFAMLSAATPGAIQNIVDLIKKHLSLDDGVFGDQYATELAIMMGLGDLIKRDTGISEINMKVKNQKFNPYSVNMGAKMFKVKK